MLVELGVRESVQSEVEVTVVSGNVVVLRITSGTVLVVLGFFDLLLFEVLSLHDVVVRTVVWQAL